MYFREFEDYTKFCLGRPIAIRGKAVEIQPPNQKLKKKPATSPFQEVPLAEKEEPAPQGSGEPTTAMQH